MPLFFMVSGMTFRPDRYASLGECAVDKAKRLLVPYLLLSVLLIPWWYLNWRVLTSSGIRLLELPLGIILSNQDLATSPFNAGWFLPCLFLVSVFYLFLWRFAGGNREKVGWLVLCAAAAGGAIASLAPVDVPWHAHTMMTAAAFYHMGYVYMGHHEEVGKAFGKRPLAGVVFVIVLLAAGALLALQNGKVSMHQNDYNNVVLFYIVAVSLSLAVLLVVSRISASRLIVYAGQNTLVTLAVHIPLIRTFQHWSPHTAQLARDHWLLVGIVVFFACVPVSMLVNRYVPWLVGRSRRSRDGRGLQR